jgi:hypothetical protein
MYIYLDWIRSDLTSVFDRKTRAEVAGMDGISSLAEKKARCR